MDRTRRFLDASGTRSDEKQALTLIQYLGHGMRCAHRDGLCRIRGRCAIRYFYEVLDILEREQGSPDWYQMARNFSNICVRAVQNGQDVWCSIQNLTTQMTEEQFEMERDESVRRMRTLFERTQKMEHRGNWRNDRCYIDDSHSYIHMFYIPHNGKEIVTPIGTMRLGQFLIILYSDDEDVHGGFFQRDEQVRGLTRQYLAYGRRQYPDDGTNNTLKWTIWLRVSNRAGLVGKKDQTEFKRNLEVDEKFLDKLETREAQRFFFQKFAVEGNSHHDVSRILHARDLNGMCVYVAMLRRRARELGSCRLPALLMRTHLMGNLNLESVMEFIDSSEACQLCFLSGKRVQGAIIIDTRAHEMIGRDPVRLCTPLKHISECKCGHIGQDFECLCEIDSLNLRPGEMISRQGNHWVSMTCVNRADAMLTTATLIHRYYRGAGIQSTSMRDACTAAIARLVLYWGCSDEEMQGVFKMLCFLYLHDEPDVGDAMKMLDLGRFLQWVLESEMMAVPLRDEMQDSITMFLLTFLQRGWWKRRGQQLISTIESPPVFGANGVYGIGMQLMNFHF
nr:NS1 [Kaptombes virus]